MRIRIHLALVALALLGAVASTLQAAGRLDQPAALVVVRVADHGRLGVELKADLTALSVNPDPSGKVEIELQGEGRIGRPGWPDLPSISRLIVVPPTAEVELEVQTGEPRIVPDAHPGIFPMIDQDVRSSYQAAFDPAKVPGFWPEVVAQMDPPVIMRGVRLVRVTINPAQFNLTSGKLRIYDQVDVSLRFRLGESVNVVERPERSRPSASALRSLRSLVANPEALRRDEGDERGAYVYVIPDFQGVAEAIAPLVTLRQRQGFPTAVITVAQNASNVDVMEALQEAYDEWVVPPEIICIVGEADLESADFMVPTWDVGRAYMWETDYKYALLEGQDLLPEAAVGRLSVRGLNELRYVVSKVVGYETNPLMDDTTWFQKAAVMANDSRTGYSSIYVQRWARQMLLEVGFAEVDTFYFIHENEESGHDFVGRTINEGISVFNYRGWGQFNGDWVVGDVRELRNGRKLPLMILPTCNTGDFADHILSPYSYAEDFLWAQAGGAIGTIGSSGFTHTNYNNVLDGGILNSFYRDSIWTVGWALNRGKLELYRHFGMFNDVRDPQVQNLLVWEAHAYQFNLIGDPGTELWTGVPQRISLEHPDTLTIGEKRISVRVTDAGESPIAGATITLMQGAEQLRIARTGADGRVLLTFDRDELIPGEAVLTAWGHNLFPSTDTLVVTSAARFVAAGTIIADDDNAGRSRGNGDRTPNPGETVELRTYIANYGEEAPQGALDLALNDVEGDYRILTGQAHLDQAPAAGDSAVVTFLIEIGRGNWNDRRLVFDLEAVAGEETWHSAIALKVASCNLEYVRHAFQPDPFRPGDTAWVDITLHNEGRMTSPVMQARLVSLTPVVNVFNDRAQFASVSVAGNDSLSAARFRVHAHSLTVPGTKAELLLLLESEYGLRDTTRFSYVVGVPRADTPFGPDEYGYVCFDNTDQRWDVAPQFNWVEIDPGLGGNGTDTEIRDRGNEQDWSVLVNLPFAFQYYGQDFAELTICSNGWIAFGNESKIADFQNRRIPPALGPRAQVCVFWDDLVNYMDRQNNQIGGVFYSFDTTNHSFIIEWSRMFRYVGMQGDTLMRRGGENTFQAILYDPQPYPTYTGDGEIVLQYQTVHNDPDVDPVEFDTPYATVGIVNLNGTGGMEYTYWNQYAAGAAALADGRAIKFSTKLIVVVGYAEGSVMDAASGRAIQGAEVRGSRGSFALTDRAGQFTMENVLIGEDYSFTAGAPGYNDSTLSGFDVAEGDTVRLHFALLHPTFTLSQDSLVEALRPGGYAADLVMTLDNDGNGPLDFTSRLAYPGGDEEGNWQRILDVDATAATGDNRLQSVDFFAGKVWLAGSNNNQNPNRFYRFENDGRLRNSIAQPGTSSFGFRGTASDGRLLYGGEGAWLIGVDENGAAVDSIPAPLQVQRAIAYDRGDDAFWIADGRDAPLVEIDRNGSVVASFQHELDIAGLAFYPDDPDGYTVYILSRDRTNPGLQVPEALVSKLNPETGDMRVVTPLEGFVEDRGGEMEITNRFDPRKWVLIALMINPGGTRFSVYDMGPNTTWISYSPRAGRVGPGESADIRVRLNSEELVEGEYNIILRFLHNAAGLQTDIPVHLMVDDEAGLEEKEMLPATFAIESAYPNPFNSTAVVAFSTAEAGRARLALYDLSGRLVASLVDGELSAGRYATIIRAAELPSGVYVVRLESAGRKRTTKIALVR